MTPLLILALAACPPSICFAAPSQEVEASPAQSPPELVPRPTSVEWSKDVARERFRMTASSAILFEEREHPAASEASLEAHAHALAEELYWLFDRRFDVLPLGAAEDRPAAANISLRFSAEDVEPLSGAYRLQVQPAGVEVTGADVHSVACGSSTFLQLLDMKSRATSLPTAFCATVEDAPSAEYRAVMIDVARQPHSVSVLEDVIRLARLYRLRYVHLHLTDDQHFTFPFPPVTSKLENNASYSMEEMRGLVSYADARGITLIPEVDLPGHSSRLRESGYLGDAGSDADVASEASAKAIGVLVHAVMEVFDSSPYFHIGGDESGAGSELVPFLERMNKVVRARGKQLIVWEGFHGAPVKELPPTGDNAVLVASWESSYNPPWNLLEAGYELINASWRPLYVVGGDTRVHPGSSGGRKWPVEEIARWNKDRFMHWEPGRPVFEDQGPGDTNLDDGIWDVPSEEWRSLILGGQLCVWEQRESSVIRDLRWRLPTLAERLWCGAESSAVDLAERIQLVDSRVFPLVQPLEFYVQGDGMITSALGPSLGGEYAYGFTSFSARAEGAAVGWRSASVGEDATWIDLPRLPSPTGSAPGPVGERAKKGGVAVVAREFDADGQPVGGATWGHVLPFQACVRVTEFDIGRRPSKTVPDFDALPKDRRLGTFELPFLRGPLTHTRVAGQRNEAMLQVPEDGAFQLSMKTQSGTATLWVDLDGDGEFSDPERLIANTPSSEELQVTDPSIELRANAPVAIRIDHATALPRPVLLVFIEGPGIDKRKEISPFLVPL